MISFDYDTHSYYNNGKKLISVTQLLEKHNLAPNYDNVDSTLLDKSAARGSVIHKEISNYLLKGEIGFTKELKKFIKANKNLTLLGSEKLVYNDIVAGTYDYLYRNKDNEIVRVDFKTTSSKNLDYVSWQLSLYDYLDRDFKANRLELWHFDKEKGLKIIPIPKKPIEEIKRLIDCETLDITFLPKALELSGQELITIKNLQNVIESANEIAKNATGQLNKIKELILQKMEENNIRSFKNDSLTITYVAPTTRESLDTARLKEDYPELLENYKKTSNIKASIRIKLKGEN